jgi:aminopeptidase N
VKTYLEKHQFANVNTTDFIFEVETASGQDLTGFVNDWLLEVKLPEDAIVKSLKQSAFMQEYFMVDCEVFTSKCLDYLVSDISYKAKIKVISQIPDKIDASAFQNSLEVRQAISRYVDQIPSELKPAYESLLNDKSYITIEAALYNLWVNFPQERVKYLQKTKDIIGFNDYNVKLLWLALHLNTVEYQPEKKQVILDELIDYSLAKYHFELRMNAFNYLKLLGAFEIESIKSLLLATKHHNWRFANFAKDVLAELENNQNYKLLIGKLKTD